MKAIILLFFIISCQRAEINRHQEGLRQAEHESYKDDESIETLHTAIDNTKNKVPDELRFLDQKISKSDYQNTLSYLKTGVEPRQISFHKSFKKTLTDI